MRIIDIHTHIFPDNLAPRAMKKLEGNSESKAFLDGTLKSLLDSMRDAKIDISVTMHISTKPSQVESINKWASEIQNNGIISFGTIYPTDENSHKIPKILNNMGIKGIKFHPDYQNFEPNAEYMYNLYEEFIKNDMIVLYHAGKDIGIKAPPKSTPKIFSKILEKFPELKLILAHTGSFLMWDEVEYYLVGSPAYFEISFTIGYIDNELFLRILKKHGFDKILFGTDSPWRDQKTEIENIKNLPIKEEEKEKIFFKNAEKLLKL